MLYKTQPAGIIAKILTNLLCEKIQRLTGRTSIRAWNPLLTFFFLVLTSMSFDDFPFLHVFEEIFICFVTDNFNIPSFCCIFVSRLITFIETRNVRFSTFVFSVKGMISVILILVVAVYQHLLSSTEQGFIGFLRGNQTSTF